MKSSLCLDFEHVLSSDVSVCASRVGGKRQLLAGAGRCVRGLVKVTRVLITSGCDIVGRVALLAHCGGIR